MEIKDFAKYVVDNMSRATIGNALKISDKIDVDNGYKFIDFINCMQDYIASQLQIGKMDKLKCYKILSSSSNAIEKYNSSYKYSKLYIINDFIIELWKIMDGKH